MFSNQISFVIGSILTVLLLVVSSSTTIAIPRAITTDIQQGCEALGGTYYSLEDDSWMCLHSTPNHNESVGIYYQPN